MSEHACTSQASCSSREAVPAASLPTSRASSPATGYGRRPPCARANHWAASSWPFRRWPRESWPRHGQYQSPRLESTWTCRHLRASFSQAVGCSAEDLVSFRGGSTLAVPSAVHGQGAGGGPESSPDEGLALRSPIQNAILGVNERRSACIRGKGAMPARKDPEKDSRGHKARSCRKPGDRDSESPRFDLFQHYCLEGLERGHLCRDCVWS